MALIFGVLVVLTVVLLLAVARPTSRRCLLLRAAAVSGSFVYVLGAAINVE